MNSNNMITPDEGMTMNEDTMIELEPERIYEAIRQGMFDAIWAVATNATGAPCGDFYHHIKEGVREAMGKVGNNSDI